MPVKIETDPLLTYANKLDEVIAGIDAKPSLAERLIKPLTTLNMIGSGAPLSRIDHPQEEDINRTRRALGLHHEMVPQSTRNRDLLRRKPH